MNHLKPRSAKREVNELTIQTIPVKERSLSRKVSISSSRAFLCNVSLTTTIVTSLVSCWFRAVSTNVADLSAVETAAVYGPSLGNHIAVLTFQARVLAGTGDMTTLMCAMSRKEMIRDDFVVSESESYNLEQRTRPQL